MKMFCLSPCMCTMYVPDVYWSQKRALDSLELVLQIVGRSKWVLGIDAASLEKQQMILTLDLSL